MISDHRRVNQTGNAKTSPQSMGKEQYLQFPKESRDNTMSTGSRDAGSQLNNFQKKPYQNIQIQNKLMGQTDPGVHGENKTIYNINKLSINI